MKDCTFIHNEEEPERKVVRSESPSTPRPSPPRQPKSEQHERRKTESPPRPRLRQPMPPKQPPPHQVTESPPRPRRREAVSPPRPRLRQPMPPKQSPPPKLRSEVAAVKAKGGASRAQLELRSSEVILSKAMPPQQLKPIPRLRSPEAVSANGPPCATKTKPMTKQHERGRSPEVTAAKPKASSCPPRSRSPRQISRFSMSDSLGSVARHDTFDAVCVLASQTGPFVWVGGMHGGSNLSGLVLDKMHVKYVVPCKNFRGRVSLDSDRHHWMHGAEMLFDHAKPELFFVDCRKLFSNLIWDAADFKNSQRVFGVLFLCEAGRHRSFAVAVLFLWFMLKPFKTLSEVMGNTLFIDSTRFQISEADQWIKGRLRKGTAPLMAEFKDWMLVTVGTLP